MGAQVRRIRYLITLLAGLAPACGGAGAGEMAALPTPVTRATLAGPLCEGTVCKCREAGDRAGTPMDGAGKRYEIRIGPTSNELWVTLDENVFYKDAEQVTACFYVDLRPGEHPVRLHAQGNPGFDARLSIAELQPVDEAEDAESQSERWYDTFDFTCGAPGHCDLEQLRDWQASLSRYRRRLHDPCGTTRISRLAWQTGEAPDRMHPTALQLDLVLDVYEFPPAHGPGDPACANAF